MTTIEKLQLIEDAWRHYIWEYNFFREKLNFNDELCTNYVGVIFGYYHDTLPIVKNYLNDKNNISLNNQFLNSIGLLQVIYLQQDLIIELNKSFGLGYNLKENENRELRNELIGHPISRSNHKPKLLESFCLFGYETSKSKIVYLKYAKSNGFKFEAKEYLTNDIIENHIQFLNENFDLILNKIKLLFIEFKKQLTTLLNNFNTLDFETLLIEISKNYNYFFESNKVCSYENILKCHKLKHSHPRYNYNKKLFLTNLKISLIEDINNINHKYLNKKEINIEVNYQDLSSNYEFGKLYTKHPVFGISYFKEKFTNDKIIIDELNNMEININDDFEYYSSYNYLQYLLNINYPSFFNN
jgi:hypothetical protein